jgi:transposase
VEAVSLPRHGTHARYTRGCTCERCHAAYKAYHREWQRRGAANPRPNALYRRIAPDAARLYLGGLSLNQVATELGVSRGTVDQALKWSKVTKRPEGNPDNLRFIKQPGPVKMLAVASRAARLYGQGLTMREVAERLQVGQDVVHRALIHLGVERRESGAESAKRIWTERRAAQQ